MRKLTFEQASERIKQLGFDLLSYNGARNKCLLLCGYGHEWNALYTNVANGGRGCPHCAKRAALTLEQVTERIEATGITLVKYGGRSYKSSTFRCPEGHEWNNSTNNILNGKQGCPHCAGRAKLSFEEASARISEIGYELIKYGGTTHAKATFKCPVGHIFDAKFDNIIRRGKGCRLCTRFGFKPDAPAYVYVVIFNSYLSDGTLVGSFIKNGITNDYSRRKSKINNQTTNNVIHKIMDEVVFYFEKGSHAELVESMMLEAFIDKQYTGLLGTSFDGKTELLDISVYDDVVAVMESVVS